MYETMKSIKYQLSSILFVAIYIVVLFSLQYTKFSYPEKMPQLLEISNNIKKLASQVDVGFHINNFPEFSFNQNVFAIDAIVWFKYLKSTVSLDTIERFSFQNSKLMGGANIVYKSKPIIKVIGKHVLVCYHVYAEFMADLKFKRFPVGDHRLSIVLQNRSVSECELNFNTSPKNITLSDNILVDNWVPKSISTKVGYKKSVLIPKNKAMEINYPCVAFGIDFESLGARNLISLYFPMFILFFIILISLTLDVMDNSRLALVASAAPALVLFRLVIDGVSPSVGYTTHIDFVYYLVVFLSLLVLFFQTYVVLVVQKINKLTDQAKNKLVKKLKRTNDLSFFVVLILLISILTYNYFR
jgi:hypothetical protein